MNREELIKNGYVEIAPGQWAKPNIKGLVDGKIQEKKSTKRHGHILDLPLTKVSIVLRGDPMPKQSVRSFCTKKVGAGGHHIIAHYQPKEMGERKKDYQQQLREQLPLGFQMFKTRIHVRKFHCVYSPLKGFSKAIMETIKSGGMVWKETQPDIVDNLKKLVFDSMAGIVYANDGAVVSEDDVKKYYGMGGCVIIELEGI